MAVTEPSTAPRSRRGLSRRAIAWLTAVAIGQAAIGAAAPTPPVPDLADRVLACTVGITCTAGAASFSGSGTVVSPDGHVLTSSSVVPGGATDVVVMFPGFVRRPASIVATDDTVAATLLKVDARDLAWLPLARGMPAVGEVAFTAGDVDDVMLANGRASFSRGVVSGVYPVTRQGEAAYEGAVVETTAAVNPGADGGPLVDASGRLRGVVSLSVSPLRWQGVAVPAAVLAERFSPFAPGGPLAATVEAAPPSQRVAMTPAAEAFLPALVGIEVERTWKPELLPQISWEEHRRSIADWDKLSAAERRQRFAAFANRARAFEVNQLLRRPPGQLTGLVVSPDGFVLTSLFNVGDDTAFVAKTTGQPRPVTADLSIEKLLAEPEGGFEPRPNAIKNVTVILPDGSRRPAKVHARHEPLGVALVKIEADGLAWFDVAGSATSPQLGDAVAVLGHLATGTPRHTLNVGIVSAPARNRGQQFQTDALLNYGNSGGPVFDAAGSFLGIAAAPIEPDTILGRMVPPQQLMRWTRAPNSGVGMVARADRLRGALEAMKGGRSFERIPGPFLGVQADESRAFGETVVLGGVAPKSPAAEAGLRKGDVVLEFNGSELRDWRDLTDRIAASKAGETVVLKVQRKGGGPRLVIAGRDVETLEDLARLKKSLAPGDTFEGTLTADDTREVRVVLGENR
jgi:S1-C subfamily serine protease